MSASKQTGKGGETTRFKKGQSGNPKGRPRSGPKFAPSAYNIIIDRSITITKDGVPREATVEEALQIKTYHAALSGNPTAEKEVLKMIAERENALAEQPTQQYRPRSETKPFEIEQDPFNAYDALLLLDLAVVDDRVDGSRDDEEPRRLLLQPWAVQMALARRGLGKLEPGAGESVVRCTLNPETLVWPRRFKS